jgi:hypothetical protein
MLQARPPAIHFKSILDFGEGQAAESSCDEKHICSSQRLSRKVHPGLHSGWYTAATPRRMVQENETETHRNERGFAAGPDPQSPADARVDHGRGDLRSDRGVAGHGTTRLARVGRSRDAPAESRGSATRGAIYEAFRHDSTFDSQIETQSMEKRRIRQPLRS